MQKKRLSLRGDKPIEDLLNNELLNDNLCGCNGGYYHAASVVGSNDQYFKQRIELWNKYMPPGDKWHPCRSICDYELTVTT